MSTLFYHPSVRTTGSTKSVYQGKSDNAVNVSGFLSALSYADAQLSAIQFTETIASKYDIEPTSAAFADTEALLAYAQSQVGIENIVIAPNILEAMQTDARLHSKVMRSVDTYFGEQASAIEEHMDNLGHKALAMGLVIRPDATTATWVRGDYTESERLDVMATSMSSAAGEESQAMREARKQTERQESIRDFTLQRAISALQAEQALSGAHILRDLLYA